jgi:hypothetical protein
MKVATIKKCRHMRVGFLESGHGYMFGQDVGACVRWFSSAGPSCRYEFRQTTDTYAPYFPLVVLGRGLQPHKLIIGENETSLYCLYIQT